MSHFTVLIIGDDIEEQMAPFQENNIGDCPREYLEFEDKEDEYREEWEANEKTIRDWSPKVRMQISQEAYDELEETGTVHIPSYRNEVFEAISRGQKNTAHVKYKEAVDGKWCSESIDVSLDEVILIENGNVPANNVYAVTLTKIEHKDIPIQDYYKTFENYVKDYHGIEKDEETGRYGYWHNPNCRWDWYQIGGRWRGNFKLRPGCEGQLGEAGTFNNDPKHEGWVDQARKGDIDWDTMREAEKVRLSEMWDKAHEETDKKGMLDFLYDIKEGMTKEQYISDNYNFSTFAVLKDGQWYEKGEMGWWAIVTDEKEARSWNTEVANLIESVDDDTLLTVCDCHT